MTVFCSGLTPFSLLNCCPALLSYHHSFDPISFLFPNPFPFLIRAALTYACKCVAGLDGTESTSYP